MKGGADTGVVEHIFMVNCQWTKSQKGVKSVGGCGHLIQYADDLSLIGRLR